MHKGIVSNARFNRCRNLTRVCVLYLLALQFNLLKNRFEGMNRDLSFLEGFFPPAIDLMPLKYQDGIRERLEHYLFAIDETYYPEITTHSMTEWKNLPSTKEAFSKFKFN